MRAHIFAMQDGGQGAALEPIAVHALKLLRDRGVPPPQSPATQFGSPHGAGGSDAV